jgi:hypothetical protein
LLYPGALDDIVNAERSEFIVPRDLRKYAANTTLQLVLGAVALLLVVGLGLIALIYGSRAALMGFICILGGLILVGLVTLLVFGLEKLLKWLNKD